MHSLMRICDRLPISAYGRGGFKFGQTRHDGSVLILADGVYGWDVSSIDRLDVSRLIPLLLEADRADFFLLGTGASQIFLDHRASAAFETAGLGLEVMSTGAACRTANVLLAEQRHFAAGLIAI